MRLLSTKEVRLDDFSGSQIPPYAILSHRWLEEEVVLRDVLRLQGSWDSLDQVAGNSTITSRKGFEKLERAVQQARRNDFDYIWIDTCCIDKSSSAELSEAINSMYAWYAKAEVCYAYLYDVEPAFLQDMYSGSSSFQTSSWFKRGWTLQELIAPKEVEFFASDWSYLGTKGESNQFTQLLHTITGISYGVLHGEIHPSEASISARMAWAASRETTRVEDLAYCLLGLFEVNMPLLYGEGEKAFIRLQEQILSQNDDETLFAWNTPEESNVKTHFGVLADHPSYFRNSGNLEPISRLTLGEPWDITSKGLKVFFNLQLCSDTENADYFVMLNCETRDKRKFSPVIYLKRLWVDEFARVAPHKTTYRIYRPNPQECSPETIYFRQNPSQKSHSIRILTEGQKFAGDGAATVWSVEDVHPRHRWAKSNGAIILKPSDFRFHEALALLRIKVEGCGMVDVGVGLKLHEGREFKSWCSQSKADSSNWGVGDNFWILNQRLHRGDIPDLSWTSKQDMNGERLPTIVTVTIRHGYRTLDLKVGIKQQQFESVDPFPQRRPDDRRWDAPPEEPYYFRNSPNGLEAVVPNPDMPIFVPRELPPHISRKKSAHIRRRIIFNPVGMMHDLILAYIEHFVPGDEPDWDSCAKSGMLLYEIFKRRKTPEIHNYPYPEMTSIHSLVNTGLVEDALLQTELSSEIFQTDKKWGMPGLHWAILGGQHDLAERMIEAQPETVYQVDAYNFSILHVACGLGDAKAVNMLFRHYCSRGFRDRARMVSFLAEQTHDTPLHLLAAFENGYFWHDVSSTALQFLLEAHANHSNRWGATPLHVAALTNDDATAKILLTGLTSYLTWDLRDLRNLTPAIKAHRQGRDYNLLAQYRASRLDGRGRSVAWYAAFSNAHSIINIINTFTEAKAIFDLADDYGFAPIHVACHLGHLASLEALLECGANMNCPAGEYHLLPTEMAALSGQKECLDFLLKSGAQTAGERDTAEMTFNALELAVANGHLDCAMAIMEKTPMPFTGGKTVIVKRGDDFYLEDMFFAILQDYFKAETLVPDEPPSPRVRRSPVIPSSLQRKYVARPNGKNRLWNLFS